LISNRVYHRSGCDLHPGTVCFAPRIFLEIRPEAAVGRHVLGSRYYPGRASFWDPRNPAVWHDDPLLCFRGSISFGDRWFDRQP